MLVGGTAGVEAGAGAGGSGRRVTFHCHLDAPRTGGKQPVDDAQDLVRRRAAFHDQSQGRRRELVTGDRADQLRDVATLTEVGADRPVRCHL